MEKELIVYFEAFGKKMKMKVFAENADDAKQKVLNKITFLAVEKPQSAFNAAIDTMDDIMNTLNGKK